MTTRDQPAGCVPATLKDGPLPGLDDPEGARLPESLPPVVDAHVHLFPDRVFEAIWRWFDQYGWPIRYKLPAPAVVDFLLSRGVSKLVALHYAHRPGMARTLNRYMAGLAADEPRVVPMATVLPGEPGAVGILDEAFDMGLAGVKLHCHVQCFSVDAPEMNELYEVCARRGRPMVIHAGREPNSPAYACDPYVMCGAERVERALRDHPGLRLVVPHLGLDEVDAYGRLLERYDHLWLDTTMVVGDYFDIPRPTRLVTMRPERVMYGTDFPNIPYAWDRELKKLLGYGLDDDGLAAVLGGTADALFQRFPITLSAGDAGSSS